MLAEPLKETPPIVRAVERRGAEFTVSTGVVVPVATVKSPFAELTEVTVPLPALPLLAAVILPFESTVKFVFV